MKIVILGLAYPYRGGISDTNESLYNALQKKGHEVELINFSKLYPDFIFPGTSQFHQDLDISKAKQHKRLLNSINPFSWYNTAKEIKKIEPDLILVRFWLPFLAIPLGTVLQMCGAKAKKIMICDNLYPHEARFGDDFLIKYMIQTVDACMTLSRNTMNEFRGISKKKVDFFPHPINDDLGEKSTKEMACAKLGLDKSKDYFLHFGLIRKYKGLDLTIKSFAEYKNKGGKANLIIAGEFYDEEQPYLDLITQLGIENEVVLHNFFIPKQDIKHYFSAADLLMQTYTSASQSGVSQMAYHFDLPLLVTNVGGLPEMVAHGESGFVVEKNYNEIAMALLTYTEKNKQDFVAFIQKTKHKYSWLAFVKKLEGMYHEI